jgi:RimJ/RimL family protein N-acetyltransferase
MDGAVRHFSPTSAPNQAGTLIGLICIPRVSSDGEIPEIGYGIHSDYLGRGYASEAVGLFTRLYWAEESIAPYLLLHPESSY